MIKFGMFELHVPRRNLEALTITDEYRNQAASGGFDWDKYDPVTKLLRRFYGCWLVIDE